MVETGSNSTASSSNAVSSDEIVVRMQRVIARSSAPRPGFGFFLAQMGVLGACAFGAWWTVEAVAAGRPWAVVFRFVLSAVLGVYYLIIARIVRFAR
jgi:hypothetical protein